MANHYGSGQAPPRGSSFVLLSGGSWLSVEYWPRLAAPVEHPSSARRSWRWYLTN